MTSSLLLIIAVVIVAVDISAVAGDARGDGGVVFDASAVASAVAFAVAWLML